MAHGWRGRAARIGAAVAVCTGLGGCLSDDKKPYTPPAAKGTTASPPAGTRPAATGQAYPTGLGAQPAPGYQPTSATRPPTGSGAGAFAGPNPNHSGSIDRPAVPGPQGLGAPIPGTQGLVPPVGPTSGSHYTPPSRPPTPAGPTVGLPVEPAGGLAGARPPEMPPIHMTDLGPLPPPPPSSGLNPPVGPPGELGPPTAPPGPVAPLARTTSPASAGRPRSSGPSGRRRTRP